ncbi:MAG: MOSC domain-containing protein, partial [Acidimicrobiia bacterium]|nr:MOSC domain-containing protein [Acidimicrobiia bacterium]
MAGRLDLLSVNVGTPAVLHVWRGEDVVSAIAKRPVAGDEILVTAAGLEGDGQADTRAAPGGQVHGGRDKAVYAYPSEHLMWWEPVLAEDRGLAGEHALGPAAFGENLTTAGTDEGEACIGDTWRWGEAVLQVTQPRAPCYKLNLHRGFVGRDGTTVRMNDSGRTGWYLRVLEQGRAPVAGPIEVAERHPAG